MKRSVNILMQYTIFKITFVCKVNQSNTAFRFIFNIFKKHLFGYYLLYSFDYIFYLIDVNNIFCHFLV